ncbi:STAS domain-containing protein [Streptomyces sp. NPDC047002]|uniref:STAS domain-containing protein n=1 Tax=Streptomyces sp. NPDC047002 TaxID=3155475 RepID=UPI00345548C0
MSEISDLTLAVHSVRGARAVVSVEGDLDLNTAGELYARAGALLAAQPLMVMDLSGVAFCDSSGFNSLLRLRRRADEAGGQLVLAAPPPNVARLLALTGAEGVFAVYGTRSEALAAHPVADDG